MTLGIAGTAAGCTVTSRPQAMQARHSETVSQVAPAVAPMAASAMETCTPSDRPDVDGADKSMEPTDSTLEVLSVAPYLEGTVRKDTVLAADLTYRVKGFEADQFIVMAQFNTTQEGATTDGTFNSYPALMAKSGRLRFCFPLSDVWDDPAVVRPLVVRFYLAHKEGGTRSVVVAHSKTLTYRTDSAP